MVKHAMYGDAFDYHFIGHLQSRKAKLVVPLVSLIHSVSTMSVVQEIEARAANATDVLLEVNIAGEESKSGVAPAAADAFLEEAASSRQGPIPRADVHAALVRRRPRRASVLRADPRTGAAAFVNVAGNVYFRPAIDGYECRLRGRGARGRDHRAHRQRALLTR